MDEMLNEWTRSELSLEENEPGHRTDAAPTSRARVAMDGIDQPEAKIEN
jgi:hypothetical protein